MGADDNGKRTEMMEKQIEKLKQEQEKTYQLIEKVREGQSAEQAIP